MKKAVRETIEATAPALPPPSVAAPAQSPEVAPGPGLAEKILSLFGRLGNAA